MHSRLVFLLSDHIKLFDGKVGFLTGRETGSANERADNRRIGIKSWLLPAKRVDLRLHSASFGARKACRFRQRSGRARPPKVGV